MIREDQPCPTQHSSLRTKDSCVQKRFPLGSVFQTEDSSKRKILPWGRVNMSVTQTPNQNGCRDGLGDDSVAFPLY